MNRMERFERIWSAQHAVPPESLLQYRWVTQEGYRLPAMAAHFRTFCETLDSLVIELPESRLEGDLISNYSPEKMARNRGIEACRAAIEAAGLKVKS